MRSLDYCSHGKKLMLAPTEPCDECKEIEDIEYMLMDLQSLTRRLLRRKAVLFSNVIPRSEAAHLRSAQDRIERAVEVLDVVLEQSQRLAFAECETQETWAQNLKEALKILKGEA